MTAPDPTAAFRDQLCRVVADRQDRFPRHPDDVLAEEIVDALEPVIRQIVAAAIAEEVTVVCPHCDDGFTPADLFDGDVLIVCTMCAKAGREAAPLGGAR